MLLLVARKRFVIAPVRAQGTLAADTSEVVAAFACDTRMGSGLFGLGIDALIAHFSVDIVDGGLGTHEALEVGFHQDL